MKTNVKPTSRKAHKINIAGRLYRPCDVAIIKALRKARKPLSRTELEMITGLRINQITGRVNDLLKARAVKVDGTKICTVTKREVEAVLLHKAWPV